MAVTKKQTIETLTFRVNTTRKHIEEGQCRDPNRCMEKLAIYEALSDQVGEVERVRIDGAQIKFNLDGYRWYATTPKKAKVSLIQFDNKKTAHLVRPHSYEVTAIRGTKIQKMSAERYEQVQRARKARISAGTPDKRSTTSLHQRVVGLGAV